MSKIYIYFSDRKQDNYNTHSQHWMHLLLSRHMWEIQLIISKWKGNQTLVATTDAAPHLLTTHLYTCTLRTPLRKHTHAHTYTGNHVHTLITQLTPKTKILNTPRTNGNTETLPDERGEVLRAHIKVNQFKACEIMFQKPVLVLSFEKYFACRIESFGIITKYLLW